MSGVKETILKDKFINASSELGVVMVDPNIDEPERNAELNRIWRAFRGWVYENYEEK